MTLTLDFALIAKLNSGSNLGLFLSYRSILEQMSVLGWEVEMSGQGKRRRNSALSALKAQGQDLPLRFHSPPRVGCL